MSDVWIAGEYQPPRRARARPPKQVTARLFLESRNRDSEHWVVTRQLPGDWSIDYARSHLPADTASTVNRLIYERTETSREDVTQ